jgi:hypothetical protein
MVIGAVLKPLRRLVGLRGTCWLASRLTAMRGLPPAGRSGRSAFLFLVRMELKVVGDFVVAPTATHTGRSLG